MISQRIIQMRDQVDQRQGCRVLASIENGHVAVAGTFVIRRQARGNAGKALQAAGVALGSTIRLSV